MASIRHWLRGAGLAAATVLGAFAATPAHAQSEPVKIGILHSLSGTMAISETTLKDVMLMLIEEQNKRGGVLGRKLEAVVVDPASNWPLFAEKARDLIQRREGGCRSSAAGPACVAQDGAAGVRGVERPAVLPRSNTKAKRAAKNIFYTGSSVPESTRPSPRCST